jgi:hypothetical protein
MTAKEKFKAYYLPWLIAMTAVFGIRFIFGLFGDDETRKRVLSLNGILLLTSLIVVIATISGGIYHWFHEVYRPKRQVKLFNRLKALDLTDIGLKINESERNFTGYYKGYYLTIFPDSSADDGDWIRTSALIIPKETQEEIYTRVQKKFELNIGDDLVWFTAKTKMKFGKCPKVERVKADINELIDTLRFEKIEPLNVTEE